MSPPRKLTDEDVAAIVNALLDREEHCRYDATPEEVRAAVDLAKHLNEAMTRSKNVFIDWLVKMAAGAIVAFLFSGKLYGIIHAWVTQ